MPYSRQRELIDIFKGSNSEHWLDLETSSGFGTLDLLDVVQL